MLLAPVLAERQGREGPWLTLELLAVALTGAALWPGQLVALLLYPNDLAGGEVGRVVVYHVP